MGRQTKRELIDRLIALLQQRLGGKEAYGQRARELSPKGKLSETHDIDPEWITNFNALNRASLELIIEALEQEYIDMNLIKKIRC